MIGESVAAVVEERIAETITADAGRHRLALLHGIKAAAGHMAGDVPSAKLAGAGLWRGHRSKRDSPRTNTAAGAASVFKRSLIILSLFFLGVGSYRGVA